MRKSIRSLIMVSLAFVLLLIPLSASAYATPIIHHDRMFNTTEVRDFYTNVYPHVWDGPTLKIPYVAVCGEQNKVVKVLIRSSWDPATIGMTAEEVNEYIEAVYGIQPTYV